MSLKRTGSALLAAIFLVAGYPLPAFSQAYTLPRLAVIELHYPGSSPDLTRQLTDEVRKKLKDSGRLDLLSRSRTSAGLASLSGTGEAPKDLGIVIKDGEERYFQMDLDTAKFRLGKRLSEAESGRIKPEEVPLLSKGYLLLGMIQLVLNEEAKANRSFEESILLTPSMKLTLDDYPPKVISHFEAARQRLADRGSGGSLVIRSSLGKGEVYVDGVGRGKAPVELTSLQPGRHYVSLEGEDYRVPVKVVEVSNGPKEVDLSFEGGPASEVLGITLTSSDTLEATRRASIAGQWLGVDYVALVDVITHVLGISYLLTADRFPEPPQNPKPDRRKKEGGSA